MTGRVFGCALTAIMAVFAFTLVYQAVSGVLLLVARQIAG